MNKRIRNNRPIALSTNLEPEKIRELYNDRIASRLAEDFEILLFFGKDIRRQKNKNLEKLSNMVNAKLANS